MAFSLETRTANTAANAAECLIAERAQTIWNERCKTFEEQWRVEQKARKERAQNERVAEERRRRDRDAADAAAAAARNHALRQLQGDDEYEMIVVRDVRGPDGTRFIERQHVRKPKTPPRALA